LKTCLYYYLSIIVMQTILFTLIFIWFFVVSLSFLLVLFENYLTSDKRIVQFLVNLFSVVLDVSFYFSLVFLFYSICCPILKIKSKFFISIGRQKIIPINKINRNRDEMLSKGNISELSYRIKSLLFIITTAFYVYFVRTNFPNESIICIILYILLTIMFAFTPSATNKFEMHSIR